MSEPQEQACTPKDETQSAAIQIGFWGWPALVAFMVFALDQLSKVAVDYFFEVGSSRPVIPGLFELVHVRNTGCAWGMFSEHTWVLALFSLAVFIAIAIYFRKLCGNSRFTALAMSLLQGGIAGNMIDRGIRTSVVDFLDFHIGMHHWPSFNIADTAICIAVGLLLIQSFFLEKDKKEK